ncbi:terminase large subunit [Brevundimonas sp. S30B]|uniref:terminase large subunit n=1 Tax=unclassified Brevundimonas TaxID=2622653 RepID=UPI001071FB69|nr:MULTISPECIES: terminase large subunit [unclassified Brevundimonas]QBX37230.1 terminase large subunit [Brevundimonas sp. MF30-B]TFW03976.1 terminase large subunit [Brevundimonas sp. S30B]
MAARIKGHGARDYAGIAERWAKQVDTGRVVACKWVKLACRRHLADLARAKRDRRWGYVFDRWHADDVCDFIEKLPHVEGVWETPNIRLEPPQIFILVAVFGWRRRDDGCRRFSYAYVEMARKGAKSTLTAGVSLYCLTCEGEVGPQVVIGATTGAQAGKVFDPARKMVGKSPDLREAFGVEAWAKSITCSDNGGYIQPINSKGSTQDGHNPHLGVLDELHAHPTRALFDVIKSAFGARQNPLMWIITTAGFKTNGICYEQRTYLTKVLEGIFEADHYFGIIFTLDEEVLDETGAVVTPADDPYDPKVWVKANPMLGVTPSIAFMNKEAADAKASPSAEANFFTKNLNRWLGAASAWLNMTAWRACADPALSWEDFDGLDCWIGADLADKDDITALVLCAFDKQGRLIFKPIFWLPSAVLDQPDHAQGDGPAPYRTWVDQGHLQLTEGDWVDHDVIEAQIRAWIERYSVRRATGDQFAAFQQMASRINKDLGNPDDPVAAILPKNARNHTDPAKEIEARVKAGPSKLRHDGNPVMDWMASNVVVTKKIDGTILPKKESPDSPNKIDGMDALVTGLHPAMSVLAQEQPMKSYLETGELIIL